MIKLLSIDLGASVPYPVATPELTNFLLKEHLNFGRTEARRWEPVHVALTDDREAPAGLTGFVRTVPFFMVSRRLTNLLRRFNCECEYLPVIAHYHGKQLEDEYFALNALRVIKKALDTGRSKVGYYDEEFSQAEGVESLVLKSGVVGDSPLSYLGEISTFAVSEILAQAITDAGLIGIKLLKPEEFKS